ncbi:Hsp67Bb (predicted) [Pycnogonum litorale]
MMKFAVLFVLLYFCLVDTLESNRNENVRSCSSETLEVCRKWTEVSFEELQDLIQAGDIQLFDVREPKELIDYGQMPNAVNIPLGQLYDALRMSSEKFEKHFRVPKPHHDDDNIMFTCLGGIRSHKALLLSHDLGFRKARHYKGGWEEWSERTNQPLKIKK